MAVQHAQREITEAALAWDGVAAQPHRFGGTEYRLGKREIGHIHGDHMVDIPFPTKVRDRLVGEGRAQPHHLLPETGWISFYIEAHEDVARAIALLYESYLIAANQKQPRQTS